MKAPTPTMTESEVLCALEESGAIMRGHFTLTSGRHSDTYVQCARILEDPQLTTALARTAASKISDRDVDIVAAPAVGGIIIGFAVAQALGVKFIFSERVEGKMSFRRSFAVPEGSRVLIVEDVVTTGGSVAEVASLVRDQGGDIAGVVAIIDRGGEKQFTDEIIPLLRLEVESWDPSECGHCMAGAPFDSPGSRCL